MSSMFDGETIRLRRITDDDVPEIVAMRADPEHLRTATFSAPTPVSADWARRLVDASGDPDDPAVGFTITDRDTGRFLGTIGMGPWSPVHRVGEVGLGLRADEVGQGYGTDAVRTFVRFAFDQLGLVVVRLGYIDNNPAAARAYARAGFDEIGRLREHVWRDAAWHDVVEMARIRPDLRS